MKDFEKQEILKVITVFPEATLRLPTCSIEHPKGSHITFCKDYRLLNFETLNGINGPLYIITTPEIKNSVEWPQGIVPIVTEDPRLTFAIYHNDYHRNSKVSENVIGKGCIVHNTSRIGTTGINGVRAPDGTLILIRHIGRSVIGNNVFLGSHSTVHRGVIDDTVVEDNVWINALCQIGDNAHIGSGTIIASGTMVLGSVRIGQNCFIGAGSVIRERVSICDDVRVGLGSLVTKNIQEPGVWYGRPAKHVRAWDGRW